MKPRVNEIAIRKICRSIQKKKSGANSQEEFAVTIELDISGPSIRSTRRVFPRQIETYVINNGISSSLTLTKSTIISKRKNQEVTTSVLYEYMYERNPTKELNVSHLSIRADLVLDGEIVPHVLECDQSIINSIVQTA